MGQPFFFRLAVVRDEPCFLGAGDFFDAAVLLGAPEALSIHELSFAGGTVQIYKKQAQLPLLNRLNRNVSF